MAPDAISSSFTGMNFSMGTARFTCGGSPSRSDAIPRASPRPSPAALPPAVGAARAGPGAGGARVRVAERRGRPRAGALELHDAEAGVEIEADHARRHGAPVAPPRLAR